MLKVFFGENRQEAEAAIRRELRQDYEVFEGETLKTTDLPSIFQGESLFQEGKRRILLKNLSENAEVWAKVPDYEVTEHEVIIWEGKIDKRSVGYKKLKETGVEMKEFVERQRPEAKKVFDVFEIAMRDGEKAVKMIEEIQDVQEPYMFFGLLVTQALKRFEMRGGLKEKRILKELAKVDMQMKTTAVEPWNLVKGFLLRVGKIN